MSGPTAAGPRPRAPGGAARALAFVALAIALGSCAPHVGPRAVVDEGSREARYRRALGERARRARMVEAEGSMWLRTRSPEELPGVEVRLVLAEPDAFRLRVESAFGTAFDVSARGDSVTAYVPAGRLGIQVDAVRDSLRVQRPGALGVRLWGALWDPPDEAWRAAAGGDSLRLLMWEERGDSVAVEVGTSGLPRRVMLHAASQPSLVVEYLGWDAWEGLLWPSRLVVWDDGGRVRLSCRINRVRFTDRVDRGRLTVRLPEGTERMSLAQLLRILERVSAL